MTDTFREGGAFAQRINQLPGAFAADIVRLGPDEIEAALEDLLRRTGETLDLDRVALAAGNRVPIKSWTRPGAPPDLPTRVVTGGGNRVCALSVAVPDSGRHVSVAAGGRRHSPGTRGPHRDCASVRRAGARARPLDGRSRRLGRPQAGTKIGDGDDFEDIIGDSPALRVGARPRAGGGLDRRLGGDPGRDRHRQGAVRAGRAQPQRPPRRIRSSGVNCAALPPTLIESELFGHERGAFTGAVAMRQGRFELAAPRHALPRRDRRPAARSPGQAAARAAGRRVRARRASQTRKVDVRVVAATHRDLDAAVGEGRFREDLYYRLNVFPIRLPPLRERTRGHSAPGVVLHQPPAARAESALSRGFPRACSRRCRSTRGRATSGNSRTSSSAR